ncbi:MAG: HRDC domain-containing protein, partial [Bifidobacteriaceae bacterium]|nr:HRDC domain-containing protein [Bifidobacteriaceae bacterium]
GALGASGRRSDAGRKGGATGAGAALSPADAALFEQLRAWRAATARERGVPAYVVFHDSTLRALAAGRPASKAELAAVPGIGRAKIEAYGQAVLALLDEELSENLAPTPATAP